MPAAEFYDPVQRHLQYLKTRELKPRDPSSAPAPKGRQSATFGSSGTKGAAKPPAVFTQPHHEDTKAATERRVRELKARLEKLKAVLEQLVSQAKARSGVQPTKDVPADKSSKAPAASGDSKPKTASEKEKVAKAAKDYYDKTHPEAGLQEQIKAVEKKIEAAKAKLVKSLKVARGKAAVEFVSKRPTG